MRTSTRCNRGGPQWRTRIAGSVKILRAVSLNNGSRATQVKPKTNLGITVIAGSVTGKIQGIANNCYGSIGDIILCLCLAKRPS